MQTIYVILLLIVIIAIIYLAQYEGFLFYDEKRFHIESSTHDMPSFTERSEVATYKQAIPFTIHQTYYTKQLDSDIYQTCLIIKNMNPEYNYAFYDDNDCRAYIAAHYPSEYLKAYDMVIPGAYKADVFRYLVLYKEAAFTWIVSLLPWFPYASLFHAMQHLPFFVIVQMEPCLIRLWHARRTTRFSNL